MNNIKPLKILVLSAKGWGTGSALRAFYVAEALKKRGHRVTFPKPLPTWPLWLDMALSTFYYAVMALAEPFDAVWCVKPYPTVVPACLIQRLLGAKIIFDVDDLDWGYSHGSFRAIHRLLQTPWPKLLGTFTTYHNKALREPLIQDFGLREEDLVQVIQAVDPVIFNPKPKGDILPPAAQALWADPKAKPRLVVTAHLNVACDLSPVLEAMVQFARRLPGARLLVAGGGPDQAKFEAEAENLGLGARVAFTGALTPLQVAACLRTADLALVYYSEGPANRLRASLKLREALACGTQVVATKVGEAESLVKHLFLSAPNPTAFAQAMVTAAQSRPKPRPKSPTWDKAAKALEEKLRSC